MIAHGINGWVLQEYDWDSETGIASITYERSKLGTYRVEQVRVPHPSCRAHRGWQERFDTPRLPPLSTLRMN